MEGITWQAGRDDIHKFQELEYRLLWKATLILQALNVYFFSARDLTQGLTRAKHELYH